MKKLFPYILIVLIVVQLLAPFTVGVGIKNDLEVKSNKAEAADTVYYYFLSTKIVEPDIGTQAWSNSFADVVDASGGITTSGKDLCEAAKTPEVMTDLEKKGYSAGPCVIVPKDQLGSGGSVNPPKDITDTVECNILSSSTWLGCIGKFLYWALYGPTSHILALAGRLLDITVDYSVKDTSYRSAFVVEGWGVVRDFCNMFFIFILLYIAFGTILKLNGVKTKEMIINVVIIGLLINFSLFATQVIIDASNILARVFYNSQTIVVGPKGEDGVVKGEVGTQGEIKLSEAIMSKTNPQDLILKAKDVGTIQTKYAINDSGDTTVGGQVSGKTFLLVTILAIIINVVGIITFLSCSLIFISRVIGLWLAMIFAPLAFFSYTVPAMQNWDMVGWKKWWPDTLKMAFLAPVFVFFLYLIVKFLETGLGIGINDSKGGLDFLLGIFVPFIFIMILLMKAKDIASKMSGTIGQSITNGIAAVGGMALGGAALGAAALGRSTVGSIAKYTQNDAARKKDATTFGGYKDWSLGKKLNPFAYVGQLGKTATAGIASGIHATGLGKKMQEAEQGFGHKTHAQHILDAKMQSEFGHQYGKDAKYKDLSEHEQKIIKQEVDKDEIAKHLYGKLFKDLEAPQAADTQDAYMGRGAYVGHAKRAISDDHGKTLRIDDETAPLAAGEKIKSDYFVGASKANAAMGEFVQSLRKGSYDIRNISQSKFTSKGMGKTGVMLAAAVASGVRMGLKSGVGVETGTGQKDFLKDIGNTITEALKGIKVNVNTGGGHVDSGSKEVKSVGH